MTRKKSNPRNFFRPERRKFLKRALNSALALSVALPIAPLGRFARAYANDFSYSYTDFSARFSESQLEAFGYIQQSRLNRGLIGFEGDYALPSNAAPVSVIVVFETSTPTVQMFEALMKGYLLAEPVAEAFAEEEHDLFAEELADLFAQEGRARTAPAYSIDFEYRTALNGVAMTLPANRVADLAEFESVRAVFPSQTFSVPQDEGVVSEIAGPWGMGQGRGRMNADKLHDLGFTGEGILVAVLDTGIDYRHPAFYGTFPTLEEMHQRGATHLAAEDLIYVNGGYYYVGRDFMLFHEANQNPASPMETSPTTFPELGFGAWTDHGTHVAGTIAGRSDNILGVAPGAQMVHYRVLGWSGGGNAGGIIAAVERAVEDQVDVINMSLGGGVDPMGPLTLAVNNTILATGVTIVVAAGNDGPYFASNTEPALASRAITVANIQESGYEGLTLAAGYQEIEAAFLVAGTEQTWKALPNGRIVSENARTFHEDGEYRLFRMPLSDDSTTGGGGSNAHVLMGAGTVSDFDLLFETYGEEALQGAIIMVRRGQYFFDLINEAHRRGLGGIISMNTPTQPKLLGSAAAGFDPFLPFFMVGYEEGASLLSALSSQEAASPYLNFGFSSFYGFRELGLSSSSSRGPVRETFEIKPDIGAHGTGVFSAVPWWRVGAEYGDFSRAYVPAGGTSMAAPHVAGVVALMMEFSERQHGQRWNYEEIKTRMMNTAMQFPDGHAYGIFDKGAGQLDVYAAVHANTVVFAYYDRAFHYPNLFPWGREPYLTVTRTGSFSFGGLSIVEDHGASYRTIEATIENQSDQAVAYRISYRFIQTGRNSQDSSGNAQMALSQSSVVVPANSSAGFSATLELQPWADLGYYEGYIVVSYEVDGIEREILLPFAAASVHNLWPITNVEPYRLAISTADGHLNSASSVLGAHFEFNSPFLGDLFLSRQLPNGELEDLGFLGFFDIQLNPDYLSQRKHAQIFDFASVPALPEGDYVLHLAFLPEEGTLLTGYEIIDIPFVVDNSAPELKVEFSFPADEGGDVLISGRAEDEFSSVEELGIFVYATGQVPKRIEADATGAFEAVLQNAYASPSEIIVWAQDGFALLPQRDQRFDNDGRPVAIYLEASDTFAPTGFLVDAAAEGYVWAGLNGTEVRQAIGYGTLHFELGEEVDSIAPLAVQPGTFIQRHLFDSNIAPAIGREGYALAGWYLDSAFTQRVNLDKRMPATDLTLYARFALASEIRFELGGAADSPTIPSHAQSFQAPVGEPLQRVLAERFELAVPSRADHAFAGWQLAPDLSRPVTDQVLVTASGMTVYAGWIQNAAPHLTQIPEGGFELNHFHLPFFVEVGLDFGQGDLLATDVQAVLVDGRSLTRNFQWFVDELGLVIHPGAIIEFAEVGDTLNVAVVFNDSAQTTESFTVSVVGELDENRVTITTTGPLPVAEVGVPYAFQLENFGLSPVGWFWFSIADGAPPGLNLDPQTGLIYGVPTVVGVFNMTVTLYYANDPVNVFHDRHFTLTVTGEALPGDGPTIITDHLADGVVGEFYFEILEASGAWQGLEWSLYDGALPDGLTLWDWGGLAGTPEEAGTFTFTVRAVNNYGEDFRAFTLQVQGGNDEAPPAPSYPLWEADQVFDSGDRIQYDGRVFEAQWWTRNQNPVESGPWGAWMEIGEEVETNFGTASVWTASRVFDNGDLVVYNERVFRARWWTRNQSPTETSPWGPWELVE